MQLKDRFLNEAVKNKDDCKRMIREDWKSAQNVLDQQSEIQFEFKFKYNSLVTHLPVQYEASIASFKEKVDA